MRNGIKRKQVCFVIGVVLSAWIFGGCEGKQNGVDYYVSPTESTQAENGGHPMQEAGEIDEWKDIRQWNDSWTVPLADGRSTEIRVNAWIEYPDLSKMSVITCKYTVFDSDFKKRIVKGIFGDLPVYLYDYPDRPVEEMPQIIAFLDGKIAALNDMLEWGKSSGNKENVAQIQEWSKQAIAVRTECEHVQQNGNAGYVTATDYTSDSYIGQIDDIWYVLRFLQSGYENPVEGYREIQFYPLSMEAVAPQEVKGYEKIRCERKNDLVSKQNGCIYSKEEAIDMAKNMLNSMGFTEQQMLDCFDIWWQGGKKADDGGYEEETPQIMDGYVIFFGHPIDGDIYGENLNSSLVGISDGTYDTDENSYGFITSHMSHMQQTAVVVSSKGVIEVKMQNMFEIQSANDVSLIHLDSLWGIIQEESKKDADYYQISNILALQYKKLLLSYYFVADEKEPDAFSYIPVWQLKSENGNCDFCINALDGVRIELWDKEGFMNWIQQSGES